MILRIDDQGYKDGGAEFRKGATLRSLMDKMCDEMNKQMNHYEMQKMKERENYYMSCFLGFADALIERLRSR